MITAFNLLLSLIGSVISWFFSLNFDGVYIGWLFFAAVLIGLIIKFFLQNRSDSNG